MARQPRLPDKLVRAIRKVYRDSHGKRSFRLLASRLGIGHMTVWRIVRGKMYRGVK